MKINLKTSRILVCSTTGQPEITVKWKKNGTIVSNDRMHSLVVTANGTDVNNTVKSALTITADPSLVPSRFANCTVKNLTTGEVSCVVHYRCQVSYKEMPNVKVESPGASVEVIGLNGK